MQERDFLVLVAPHSVQDSHRGDVVEAAAGALRRAFGWPPSGRFPGPPTNPSPAALPAGGVADHHDRCQRSGLRRRAVRADALDRPIGAGGRIARFTVAVPAGLALAAALEYRQEKATATPDRDQRVPGGTTAVFGASAGVVGILTRFAAAEHALAELGGTALARALPAAVVAVDRAFRVCRRPRDRRRHAVRPLRPRPRSRGNQLRAGARRVCAARVDRAQSAEDPAAVSTGAAWGGRAAGTRSPTSG